MGRGITFTQLTTKSPLGHRDGKPSYQPSHSHPDHTHPAPSVQLDDPIQRHQSEQTQPHSQDPLRGPARQPSSRSISLRVCGSWEGCREGLLGQGAKFGDIPPPHPGRVLAPRSLSAPSKLHSQSSPHICLCSAGFGNALGGWDIKGGAASAAVLKFQPAPMSSGHSSWQQLCPMLPVRGGSLSCTHWYQEFLRLQHCLYCRWGKAGLYTVAGIVPQPMPGWGDLGGWDEPATQVILDT